MSEPSRYVHGTHPDEQRRLSTLNELLNQRSLQSLRLRGEERVLDVGSGLGQFSLAMADALPRGFVLGIERSEEQLAGARRNRHDHPASARVDFRQGDATEIPLGEEEWGAFDVVHTRFLLEHLRDPLAVVRQMVRAAKPGGRVVLEDDDHELLRLWPELPSIREHWILYQRSYELAGNDPIIGRRLVELLHQAGARPRGNRWLFFGACAGEETFPAYVENLAGVLDGARDAIEDAAAAQGDAADVEACLQELRRWAKRPDAALWYCTAWAEGVV